MSKRVGLNCDRLPQASSKKCDRRFQCHHKRTMAENLGDYRVLLVGSLGAD
jgi:hypothetical protein